MIRHVWIGDLALIQLAAAGRTDAPREVLDQLQARGHVVIARGAAGLTAKGRRRAERLKPFESGLRQDTLRTVGGGAARIYT